MLVLLLSLGLAQAEEPTFAGTDKEVAEAEKAEAHLSAELGGAWTTGNTDFYNLSGGLAGSYKWSKNKLGLGAGLMIGRSMVDSDGSGTLSDEERDAGRVETARKAFADVRYDRFVSERASLYVLVGSLIDPFAGYDFRTHAQLGVSYGIVDTEDTSLLGEFGVDYAREDFIDGVDPNNDDIVAAKVMFALSHQFNENVAFTDTLEIYENVLDFEDMRVLNTAAITAKLSDAFSLKLGHALTFDNQPVEGFRPLDMTTTVTFVASIF